MDDQRKRVYFRFSCGSSSESTLRARCSQPSRTMRKATAPSPSSILSLLQVLLPAGARWPVTLNGVLLKDRAMTPIDLNRTFVPLDPDSEPFDWGPEMGRKYGGWLGWDELITHRRVVLLAEANSGKTEEFRLRVAELRRRGMAAFFVRVEDLADGQLIDALTPEDEERFDAWKDSADPGWFFLDSVDEARLNAKNFERALTRFRRDVKPALHRASVFVSCRVTDWRGKVILIL